MKFDIWRFFEKSVEKIQVSLKPDKINPYPANVENMVSS